VVGMRIAVFGAGGVGGYFGGRLAKSGVDVSFIARGSHLAALRENGLLVRSVHGDFEVRPVRVTDDPGEIGPVDYVLITVKSDHTEQAAMASKPLLHGETVVVSLQNGVDNEEKLAAIVGSERVVGGAAYIFATIAQPGVIAHIGGAAAVKVGELAGGRSERVGRLVAAGVSAGFAIEETEDIKSTLWNKFAFICAQAGTTAAVRLSIGEVRTSPAARELFRRVVDEVCAVARAEGVALPTDLADKHIAFADGLGASTYSSLHYDLTHGKPMELEALLGEVVRRGEQARVATPMSESLYAVLQPWDLRNRAAAL
jgi:2-dehydropantoate 2-reductase